MRQDLFYLLVLFLAEVLRVLAFFADAFGWRRAGSSFLPVERFHSSYWSSVILASTSSCANFRRCAVLLKGIKQRLANAKHGVRPARPNESSSVGRPGRFGTRRPQVQISPARLVIPSKVPLTRSLHE